RAGARAVQRPRVHSDSRLARPSRRLDLDAGRHGHRGSPRARLRGHAAGRNRRAGGLDRHGRGDRHLRHDVRPVRTRRRHDGRDALTAVPDATPRPRVVIIGGGFGGLKAAKALRKAPVDVLLIDRRNHHVFQPLLYQVATAALSPGDIAAPIRWILRHQENTQGWLGEVTSIDPHAKRLTLADGATVDFDYHIVSAGATHAYFGHDEWQRWAPGLKTLEDALDIRRRVLLAFELAERATDPAEQRRLLTFVVVGGGPTGVELAGALAEISR